MSLKRFFDLEQLKVMSEEVVTSVQNYYTNTIEGIPIQPNVKPGFMRDLLPEKAPEKGRDFSETLKDIEKHIIPNLTHWQHPNFFAYFPSIANPVAAVTEFYTHNLGQPNFCWHVSPASHEVEWIMSDWVVQLFGLPDKFLMKNRGGGGMATNTTESVVLSLNCAKKRKIKSLNLAFDDVRRLKFVGYYGENNKTWAGKALHINDVNYRRCIPVVYSDEQKNFVPDYKVLEETIKKDIEDGLIPIWYGSQLGSTDCGCHDNLSLLSEICQKYEIFLSVDCAYSSSFFICEEFRPPNGYFDNVDAITFNFAKNLLLGNCGTFFFAADKVEFAQSTGGIVGEIYQHNQDIPMPIDYKDWSAGFGRRFSSLKLFTVLNTYGAEGLREYVRECARRANYFASLVESEPIFEMLTKVEYGLACFRLKDKNNTSLERYNQINEKIDHLIDEETSLGFISNSSIQGKKFLRFVSGNPLTTDEGIKKYFDHLTNLGKKVLEEK